MLFKGLYHLYDMAFQVIILLFRTVGVSRACCSGRIWWCQIALGSVTYDLVLASHYLVISGVKWPGCL